jgi:hypothetical protein
MRCLKIKNYLSPRQNFSRNYYFEFELTNKWGDEIFREDFFARTKTADVGGWNFAVLPRAEYANDIAIAERER